MSVITSSQWTAIAQQTEDKAANLDPQSATYLALMKAAEAAKSAASNPSNESIAKAAAQLEIEAIKALENDANASAILQSYVGSVSSTILTIASPQNTTASIDLIIEKLGTVRDSTSDSGRSMDADLVSVMQLFLVFAQTVKVSARNERRDELNSALTALNAAADKIHNAALDRYKGAVGKAVFEIAGAATTIGSSVFLVKSMQANTEPTPPKRGIETDEEFQVRLDAYESTPEYRTALGDGTLADYEMQNPRPTQLRSIAGVDPSKTDAEYNTELTRYQSDLEYQALPNDPVAQAQYEAANPRPVQETPEQFDHRRFDYENTEGYRRAQQTDRDNSSFFNRDTEAVTAYERRHPRPQPETDAEFQIRVNEYENTASYRSIPKAANDQLTEYETRHPRPVQAESDAHWAARQKTYQEKLEQHTQATNMKQTTLITYSQLTGAIGQLVSAPGGVFEATYNLKAADEETQQKKLEAEAQQHNAKADDAQSTKQSMAEVIGSIINTLQDIKKNINDVSLSIVRAI